VIERPPVAPATAVRRLARCVLTTFGLLGQRRIRLPKGCVGLQLHFADGTASKVYRETVVDRSATIDPAVLVVGLVCVPGSIHYEIVLGLTREELVSDPATLDARGPTEMREALRLTAAEQLPA
jgi:hypothetical protein